MGLFWLLKRKSVKTSQSTATYFLNLKTYNAGKPILLPHIIGCQKVGLLCTIMCSRPSSEVSISRTWQYWIMKYPLTDVELFEGLESLLWVYQYSTISLVSQILQSNFSQTVTRVVKAWALLFMRDFHHCLTLFLTSITFDILQLKHFLEKRHERLETIVSLLFIIIVRADIYLQERYCCCSGVTVWCTHLVFKETMKTLTL